MPSAPDEGVLRPSLLIALVTLAAIPLSLHALTRRLPEPSTVTVQILAINDFHGNLEPPGGTNGQINGTLAGGAEYLATHLANAIAQHPASIVVAAGDVVGASPLVSSLFHDEPTILAMNAMHLAVTSVGNHEFDKGVPELLRFTRGGCHPVDGCLGAAGFAGARFQYLSANVVRTGSRTPLLPATVVRSVGGVKIGFIGETLQETPRIVSPAGTRGLTFLEEATTANLYARHLTQQGVRAIVLLIHQGGRQSSGGGAADPNGCEHLTGGILPIVKQLTPDIPIVISGHTHSFYNCQLSGHLVASAASFGRMITRLTLEIDRKTDRIVHASAVNEIVTRDVAKDPVQTQILSQYGALAMTTGNRVVGTTRADIVRAANRAGESALGDLIADAQLAATSAPDAGSAVVAFMNTGGIRADLVTTGTGAEGRPRELTYRGLFEVQPFGNVLNLITMTGDQIKQLLEQQFDNPQPGQQMMLQVSHGFAYRYRLTAPPGQRVDATSIRLDGRPIGARDRVRVTTSDFVIDSGLYPVLGAAVDRVVGVVDLEALVAYVRTHSPLTVGARGRIVRTDVRTPQR